MKFFNAENISNYYSIDYIEDIFNAYKDIQINRI